MLDFGGGFGFGSFGFRNRGFVGLAIIVKPPFFNLLTRILNASLTLIEKTKLKGVGIFPLIRPFSPTRPFEMKFSNDSRYGGGLQIGGVGG